MSKTHDRTIMENRGIRYWYRSSWPKAWLSVHSDRFDDITTEFIRPTLTAGIDFSKIAVNTITISSVAAATTTMKVKFTNTIT